MAHVSCSDVASCGVILDLPATPDAYSPLDYARRTVVTSVMRCRMVFFNVKSDDAFNL